MIFIGIEYSYNFFKISKNYVPLQQWFSTSLMLQLFNTVPHVVETLNHNIIFTLLPNCNVGTVMNYNVNI